MSQAGYTPISLYYSTTAAAVPTSGNLVAGELAINTVDGKLYYKSNAGVVTLLASTSGASGDVVGPASSTDNALARFDLATGKLIQNSVGILSDAGILTGLTGITSSGSITLSSLTSGRVTYAGTGGLLQDSANLTFNGTTLTANTIGAFTLGGTIAGGGNQINNVVIGTTTPLAGAFTTLTTSGAISEVIASGNAQASLSLMDLNARQVVLRSPDPLGTQAQVGTITNHDLELLRGGTVRGLVTSTGFSVTGTLSATSTVTGMGEIRAYRSENPAYYSNLVTNYSDVTTTQITTLGAVKFQAGATDNTNLYSSSAKDIVFFPAGTERARINSAGVFRAGTIQASGTAVGSFSASNWFIQTEDSTTIRSYNCGPDASTYARWEHYTATSTGTPLIVQRWTADANLQVNNIGVGFATPATSGSGITFLATQSASSNANTLDDYEEGTWTPALYTTGAGTFTYSAQTGGTYVKIGRLMYLSGVIGVATKSGGSAGDSLAFAIPVSAGGADVSGSGIGYNISAATTGNLTVPSGYSGFPQGGVCTPNTASFYPYWTDGINNRNLQYGDIANGFYTQFSILIYTNT